MRDARDRLAERLGVVPVYKDGTGTRHDLTPETRDALLVAMDAPTDLEGAEAALADLDAPRVLPVWQVVEADIPLILDALDGQAWRLTPETGDPVEGTGSEISALPVGIHAIETGDERAWLLAAPRQLPEPPRAWGVTVPLYGLARDGRLGSYGDLAQAAQSLGEAGADFIGVNPVHAGFTTDLGAFSPYAPSHRGRLAAMHIAPAQEDEIAGSALLDYGTALPARIAALRSEFAPSRAFEAWRAEQGEDLERFALHQALSQVHGPYWPDWPFALHDPDGDAARAFAADHESDLAFHAWLQWRAEAQLQEAQNAALKAGMRFGLYLDLAVGTHPCGAETWAAPHLFAHGVSLGAPPDAFSPAGQSWGLAPLRPDALGEDGFRALAAVLRRALSHARLLRIDHILGFERAFWVPQSGVPGAYVAMPREALMAVARIEAARAGAVIVGEDLGNIPEGLGDAMAGSGILGCRVAQFERHWEREEQPFRAAADYARPALTSWGSHDLPTWEGWKAGRDLDWRRDLGEMDAETHAAQMAERRAAVQMIAELFGGLSREDLERFLAATPSRLVALQIEDVLGAVEQPNLPGTIHQHPNWRRRLGVAPDTLGALDAMRRAAIIMADAGR